MLLHALHLPPLKTGLAARPAARPHSGQCSTRGRSQARERGIVIHNQIPEVVMVCEGCKPQLCLSSKLLPARIGGFMWWYSLTTHLWPRTQLNTHFRSDPNSQRTQSFDLTPTNDAPCVCASFKNFFSPQHTMDNKRFSHCILRWTISTEPYYLSLQTLSLSHTHCTR